jgi:hypothetical protein
MLPQCFLPYAEWKEFCSVVLEKKDEERKSEGNQEKTEFEGDTQSS